MVPLATGSSSGSLLNSALLAAVIAAFVSIIANYLLYRKRRADDAADYARKRSDESADYARTKMDDEHSDKQGLVESLLGNRFNPSCEEFLEALNKVAIVFNDSIPVKTAVKQYHQEAIFPGMNNRFVDLVKCMYRDLGLNLEPLNDDFVLRPFDAEPMKDRNIAQDLVFGMLMATRITTLSQEHVRALNGIDVAFYGGGEKEKRVREAWKAYLHHLNCDANATGWEDKRRDLMTDLLYEMGRCLGYDFDKTEIKTSSYFPMSYVNVESEWTAIRATIAGVLTGKIPVKPIAVIIKNDEEPEPQMPTSNGAI